MNTFAPRYHFAPEHGWINDPNGLVFFDGRWHLFYQYYEPADIDGMQWGHAVSADLARWSHLPPAIRPDSHGQIWSGSAVVDHHDSSGLFGGRPGMVCLFTYWDKSDFRQCQGLAYSADGVTFHTYPENPVIEQLRNLPGHPDDKDFRDPKVFFHQPSGRWIMVVAGGKLRVFSSENLTSWRFESLDESIETECPDLFELPVESEPGNSRWVLVCGGREYILGDFDGRRFTPSSGRLNMSAGPDFYASQSFSDAPGARRIIMSWLFGWNYKSRPEAGAVKNAFDTAPQSGGCLTVPYELTLRPGTGGPILCMKPVAELEHLFTTVPSPPRIDLAAGASVGLDRECACADISFRVAAHGAGRSGIRIANAVSGVYECGYDATRNCLCIDRRASGLDSVTNFADEYVSPPLSSAPTHRLRVLLDRCSVELFADDGSRHLSAFILPNPTDSRVELFSQTGATLDEFETKVLR